MTKLRRALTLALTLLLVSISSPALAAPADEAIIPDANFRKCLAEYVYGNDNNTNPITEAQLANLTDVNCERKGITDATGTHYLTGVTSLYLSYNKLTTPPVLTGLTNLTILSLRNNQLTTNPDLTGLTNLQTLDLAYNRLTTPPVLTGLTNLQTLDLGANQLTTNPDLTGLTNLTYLNVSDNSLRTPPVLTGLTNLQELGLYKTRLTTNPDLTGLTKLTSLWMNYNRGLTTPPDLTGLTNLQTLNLSQNELTTPPVLTGLTKLQQLDLMMNQLTTPPVLTGLTKLQHLRLDGNWLTTPPDLTTNTNLTDLTLAANRISDFSPLPDRAYTNPVGAATEAFRDQHPARTGVVGVDLPVALKDAYGNNLLVTPNPADGITYTNGIFTFTKPGTFYVPFNSTVDTPNPITGRITFTINPPSTVTPTAPTITAIPGPNNDTITTPTITGITYTCTTWTNNEATCTATPNPGYIFPPGTTTTWTYTDTPATNPVNPATPTTPITPTAVPTPGTALPSTGANSNIGILLTGLTIATLGTTLLLHRRRTTSNR